MAMFMDPATSGGSFLSAPYEEFARRGLGSLSAALAAQPANIQPNLDRLQLLLPPEVLSLLEEAVSQYLPYDEEGRLSPFTDTMGGSEYNRAPFQAVAGSAAFQALDEPTKGEALGELAPAVAPPPSVRNQPQPRPRPSLSQSLAPPPPPPQPSPQPTAPTPAPAPAPYDPANDPANPLFWQRLFEGGAADGSGDAGGGVDGGGGMGGGGGVDSAGGGW